MSNEAAESSRVSFLDSVRDAVDDPSAFVRRVSDDDLLYQGSILTVATVISGVLNYVFQLLMGRVLEPEEYGVFGALFAIFYLVTVLGSGIQFSATRFSAEIHESDRRVAAFYRGLFVRSLLFGLGVCSLLVVASTTISRFLNLPSVWPVLVVAATVPLVFVVMANMGLFQGLQLFGHFGSYRVLEAVVKLLAGIAFIGLGYGVFGAFGALIVAAAASFVLTTLHLCGRLCISNVRSRTRTFDYGKVYEFVPPAVLAGFCLTVPANVDVIVVRHFFSGEQAGLYTAASVLGKALIFFPTGISTALFPKVTNGRSEGNREEMFGLLRRALLYTAATAGFGSLVFWFLPELVLGLLFGPTYTTAAPLVRWYGVAILGFVLAIVVLNFELARDRTRFVYVFAAITVVETGLMWAFHGSMVRIIHVILFVNVGLLTYGLVRVRR